MGYNSKINTIVLLFIAVGFSIVLAVGYINVYEPVMYKIAHPMSVEDRPMPVWHPSTNSY